MPHRTFDHVEVRCPQLGGEVTFGYCRTVADGLPCHKALVCFEYQFPVEVFFRKLLKEETFHRIFIEPQPGRMEKFLKVVDTATRKRDKK
jgi:hypothetical protein